MSLRYIIDGYNVTNHPDFPRGSRAPAADPRQALLNLIKTRRLSGSPRNRVDVVFDGYPGEECGPAYSWANIIFSREISADERIRKMLEVSGNPRNVIVVSDDKEIRSFARIFGCRYSNVPDFLGLKPSGRGVKCEIPEPEISFSEKHRINEELKRIWLK
jgi:hypothetical protein